MDTVFNHSDILENSCPTLTHHFLMATSRIPVKQLVQSVVYLHKVTDVDVTGIVINKPLQHHLHDLLRLQDISLLKKQLLDQPILNGGPSCKDQGFIIYSNTVFSKDTNDTSLLHYEAQQDINISTSRDMLEDIAQGKGPQHAIVTIGCINWSLQEFVEELTIKNYWLIAPANKHILFKIPTPIMWQTAIASIGIDPACLSSEIGHA